MNAKTPPKDTSKNAGKPNKGARENDDIKKIQENRRRMVKEIQELKAEKAKRELDALVAEKEAFPKEGAEPPHKAIETAPISHVAPPAAKARMKVRHVGAFFSFLIFALAPPAATAWYMWDRAADRYISNAGFSVRTEEVGSAFEFLGGVAELSGSSSSDSEILYQFIQSQELVRTIDDALDLRALWSKGDPDKDPIFNYNGDDTIEDLTDYWEKMVKVFSDSGTGLIDIEVQAFTADDAYQINQAIYNESLSMINRLSAIAREDGTRYAREDLNSAVERVRDARLALMEFRNRTQIVDPAQSIQSQMGIMASLQSALAEELIELDILLQSTSQDDPRIVRAQQRVDVIEARIEEERAKFGIGQNAPTDSDEPAFAELVGEYESLAVTLEFAESTFLASQATLDAALAESRRQSRYLAAHINPTLPESPQAPYRLQTTLLVAMFSMLFWAIGLLSAYALRDRR